jgi:hypothetical protein
MRRPLAALAAVLGVLAAVLAASLWTAGREALDEDRFADRAIAALRAPQGREAIAERVAVAIRPRVSPEVPDATVDAAARTAVDRIAGRPEFAAALRPQLVQVNRALVDLSGDDVVVDLAPIGTIAAGELAVIDPALVAVLPDPAALGRVELSDGVEAPGIPGSELAGRVPEVVAGLSLLAALLIGLAVWLSRRPARTAVWIGAVLAVLAVVPAVMRFGLPRVAEAALSAPSDALARRLAEALLDGWSGAAAGMLIAGVGLAAVGALAGRATGRPGRRSGPRTRTRAA